MTISIRYKLALLTACAILPATGIFAQAPATAASTPSVSVPAADTTTTAAPDKHEGKMRDRLASLTPEERQTLKAARQKAKEDPAVKAAEATKETDRKGFHRTMAEAMVRADPSVKPILEKLREEGKHGKKNP